MAANTRARDSDRADVCGLLDAALSDGQLTAREHAERTGSAMRASSFAELDELIGDLQIPGDLVDAPVVRGGPRRSRWWLPALAIVLVALLFGLAAGCVGRSVDSVSPPKLPDLTTGPGLAYFLDRYRAEYGDTLVDDLTVYPGYALFHRSPGNPVKSQYYHFDGDFSEFGSVSGRKPDTPTVDVATMNLPVVSRLLAGAVRSLKVPDGRVQHLSVSIPSTKQTRPALVVYAQNEAQDSGNMTIAFDGEVLEVRPPRS